MKKIAYDNVKLDSVQIVKDSDKQLTVNAVISKEGVYPYPDGRALKCRRELHKMSRRLKYAGAKLIIHDHPDSMVIMSQQDVQGGVQNIFMDNGKVRAQLTFDKEFTSPEFLEKVRKASTKIGEALDVSIGFYYQPETEPGIWKDPLTGNKHAYDYIMRDMLLDHVATGVLKGRCPAPACGIGVDTAIKIARRIALDPFADYKDFADCVSKNQDKSDPDAFCAWLHKQTTGKTPAEDNTVKGGKNMKKTKADYGHAKNPEEIKAEFEKCVAERMAEGAEATPPITRGQAEALCQAGTEPADEPGPVAEQLDQEETGGEPELTAYEKCVNAKMSDGVSREDAEAECRAEHPVAEGDQEDFDSCVATKMQAGLSREEAESQCKPAETDQDDEPSLMEKCVQNKKDEGLTEEEATEWCNAELAGEHQEATDLINESQELLKMKREKDILERKTNRRHPL